MADTLLQMIQKRMAGTQPAAPAPSAQPNIEEILRAKQGKAGVAAAPGGSNVMGDVQQQGVNQAVADQQAQGQLQAAQIGQQAQQIGAKQALQAAQIQQKGSLADANLAADANSKLQGMAGQEQLAGMQRKSEVDRRSDDMASKATLMLQQLASERNIARDGLFSMARAENAELADRKDRASLEQKAFLLSMSDSDYLKELNRIGEERALQDEIAFSREARNVAFGRDLAKALDEMTFRSGEKAKDRAHRINIAELSDGQIIQLANMAIQDANNRAAWEAGGKVVTTGIDEGVKYYKNKEKTVPTTEKPNELTTYTPTTDTRSFA
jgi:hypothetical protein